MTKLAPGPTGFFKTFRLVKQFRANPLVEMLKFHERWGDMVRLPLGSFTINLAARPEYVQDFLVTKGQIYGMSPRYAVMEPLLGQGLLTTEGPGWLSRRRTMQPVFRRDRVAAWDELFHRVTDSMLAGLEGRPENEPLDVTRFMMELTFEIIGRAMFSSDLADFSEVMYNNLDVSMEEMVKRASSSIKFPMHWPTPANRRYMKSVNAILPRVEELIARRRAMAIDERPKDLLTVLLEARDPEDPEQALSDEQIRDECTTILAAGHETTANAMSWTWYLLSENPEWAERLREECRAVLGGRPPSAADLPKIPLAERIINESMRLYPPVWFLNRVAREPNEIGGYAIDPGAIVVGSAWKLHRDERWWPAPLTFDPDRFLPERSKERHRFAFFPFGGGQKMCIGENFAMLEAQIILITIIQRFSFKLVPGHPVEPKPLVTLRPAQGLPMFVKKV